MKGTRFAALAAVIFSAACADAIDTVAPVALRVNEAGRTTGPRITDLGTLGGKESRSFGLNTSADGLRLLIVGEFQDAAGRTRGASWSYNILSGGLTAAPLAAPTGDVRSSAWSIDPSGLVVGYSVGPVTNGGVTKSAERAVRWTSSSEALFLGDLGGFGSRATAINGQGKIFGSALTPNGAQHAFRWDATTGITDLHFSGNDLQPVDLQPVDMNESGTIVGGVRMTALTLQTAFVWTSVDGKLVPLPDFGPPPLRDGIVSYATGVNDAGVIVGFVNAAAFGGVRAVRWDPTPSGYVVRDLGRGTGSQANGINNREEIVGSHGGTAFYMSGSSAKDLPGLSRSASAWKISEGGEIIGNSYFHNTYNHAVLWTNVRAP